MEFSHALADAYGRDVFDKDGMLRIDDAPSAFCIEYRGDVALHPPQSPAPRPQLTLVADHQEHESTRGLEEHVHVSCVCRLRFRVKAL
jgi:hypothetical protein